MTWYNIGFVQFYVYVTFYTDPTELHGVILAGSAYGRTYARHEMYDYAPRTAGWTKKRQFLRTCAC